MLCLRLGAEYEKARVRHAPRRGGGHLATYGARAAASDARDRVSQRWNF
jgi:hypothetical protein